MGTKMRNAPVYFTVAQIQFNPILQLESRLPEIQDGMRLAHFPDFKRQFQQFIDLAGVFGQQPIVPPAQTRCFFGDIEGWSSFVLENNALAFQTTAYDTFETFSKTFLKGLAIVHDVLKLDYMERIGLRYLDAVLPQSEENVSDYLAPEVIGLSRKLSGKMQHSFSETLTTNAAGQLISRVIIQDGPVILPSEIIQLAPRIQTKFTHFTGCHAVLDTDAFCQERIAFNLKSIASKLNALHNEILNSFQVTVTEHALSVWQ